MPEDLGHQCPESRLHREEGTRRARRYAVIASEAAARGYAFDEALAWLELAGATASRGPELDEVNRRIAALLQTAGWEHPPRTSKPRGTQAWEIHRDDLDLRVVE